VTVTSKTVEDKTPPVIKVPANMTVSATGPSGAMVTYEVTATDPDNEAATLKLSCTPSSGSAFPIGETTVECSASDPAGNTSHASFKVTVTGATEDPAFVINGLLEEVRQAPIPHHIRFELSDRLNDALRRLQAPDPRAAAETRHRDGQESACSELERFIELVARDQSRKRPRIPPQLASAWSQTALSVQASLRCSSDHESDRDPDRR
jgi:hypothetical protein